MIWASGKIIRSGIRANSFSGMLDGPLDLFGSEFMISNISSLDIWAIKNSVSIRFFKNLEGEMLGILGTDSSVLGPTFTKNSLKLLAGR